GVAKLILERLITGARHVEVQVIGDAHGSVIHLGERDCSAQRRHQKVIEEAPSPAVDPVLRARMGAAAVAAAQAVGYQGAGTVEFLLEPSGAFYFLEMNTRLQVEHPVTEAVTGLDLVGLQLDLAAGAPLPLTQDDVALNGHALEARLYAEDPGAGFLPAAGPLLSWDMPDDLRVEAGYRAGDTVSPHYDAMLAKIIAWGDTRGVALARLRAGLERLSCLGLPTNRGHLLEILDHPDFIAGAATTDWLETEVPGAAPAARSADVALAAAAWLNTEAARLARIGRINPALRGFGAPGSHLMLAQGDHRWDLFARPVPKGWHITGKGFAHQVTGMPPTMAVDGCRRAVAYAAQGDQLWLAHDARDMAFRRVWATPEAIAGPDTGRIIAPMAGALVALDVAPGDRVDADDRVAVIEAMKMSHALRAGRAGIVTQVGAALGDQVAQGAAIVTLAAQDADQEENADNADTG
ncbi:MAG: biotin/lipoyl-containing protein, partial [Pseudomonadota bacterium]